MQRSINDTHCNATKTPFRLLFSYENRSGDVVKDDQRLIEKDIEELRNDSIENIHID